MTAQPDLEQSTTTGWPWRLGNEFRLLNDGGVAFVGGAGLTDDFAPGARRGPCRELMVEIQGAVIADCQRAFRRTWRRCGPELALVEPPACEAHADGAAGRLSLSEARQRSVLANGVLRRIDSATARAWIMSAYFVPSRRFRKALRRAARRGVDVRLLLPGARTDHPWVRQAARRFYGKLLRNGVKKARSASSFRSSSAGSSGKTASVSPRLRGAAVSGTPGISRRGLGQPSPPCTIQ